MPPFVAVTAGEIIRDGEAWTPIVYGQSSTYTNAVVHAGGIPIIVPLVDEESVLRKFYDLCSGLLLTGGNDVDPTSYNAESSGRVKSTSPRRDKQELKMLKWAIDDDKPVLGICRGMQLINVAMGGDLYQDIAAELPEANNHELSFFNKDFMHLAHELQIDTGSKLAAILGTDCINANALHHQAVHNLGKGLVATAHAEDGIIEAIELPEKSFVIGVQSHPEALEAEIEPLWCKLFDAFVEQATALGSNR